MLVYVVGVRPGKSWGGPLMGLLVLGAVVAVVVPILQPDVGSRRALEQQYEEQQLQRIHMLGQKLAPELSPDDHVLFIIEPHQERQLEDMKEAFKSGTGGEINIGFERLALMGGGTRAFNSLIAPYQGKQLDLIISFVPLQLRENAFPLERLTCFRWDDVPMFVAAQVDPRYDPDVVREYIEDGLLSAVILSPGRGKQEIVIGADNLQDLPETSAL